MTLDVNELARGEKFMNVSFRHVSDDGNLLAYATDNTGFRDYRLHVRDLRTGKDLPDTADRVSSAGWAADNRTLFYATTDPAKRPFRVWRHTLGADAKSDAMLYEEKDEMFRAGVYRTRNGDYVFFPSNSLTTSELRYLKAASPVSEFRIVAPRRHDIQYGVEPRGDVFYILTNDKGRNKRIVTAPASDPRPENWKELIAHRDDVMLEDLDIFKDFGVVSEREDALPRIAILDLATGKTTRIQFPEQIYSAGLDNNPEFDTKSIRYDFESFTTPPSIYEYDVAAKKQTLLKRREVPGGYDPSMYVSERRFAKAADGTRDPHLRRLQEGVRRGRPCPDASRSLWLVRGAFECLLQVERREPHGPRVRPRPRAHPRRRGPRQEMARPGPDALEEEHLYRLHRGRRAARRGQVHLEGPARDRGRQRGRASDGRRHEHAP